MQTRWKRNLRAIAVAEFLAIMGFSSSYPIWSYFIASLGADQNSVARWSGIVMSAASISMGIMAPIWGKLSDRYGRKMMVMRAMFGGAISIGLMGFSQTPLQMAILRFIQGMLTGTVSAATAMVASQTPRERLGQTLGTLQLAIFLGQSFGPISGGFIADILGYRATFWITSAFLLISGLIMLLAVEEDFTPVPEAMQGSLFNSLKQDFGLLAGSTLALILGLRFAMRVGMNMRSPILPLLIASLNPAGSFLGSASGFLTTVSGIFSAITAPLVGRRADKRSPRNMLLIFGLIGGVAMIAQAFAPSYWVMLFAQVFIGIGMGGTLASLSSLIARNSPEGKAGTTFGLDAMAVSLSGFFGPTIGGWLGDLVSLQAAMITGGVTSVLGALGALLLPVKDKPPAPGVETVASVD